MKQLGFILLTLLCLGQVRAQQPRPLTADPTLVTTLGNLRTGKATVAQVKALVDSAVRVRDGKGKIYQVTDFRINYRFTVSYEDEETGNKVSRKDLRVSDFSGSDLINEPWRNSIRENAAAGDEILINNVKIRLKNGKKGFAPDLRITVQ
jgi:hypothetical protein